MMITVRSDVVDGHILKWLLAAGVSWLEYHKEQVNNMNVFPVPDGDTGENMLATVRQAYKQIASDEEEHVGKLFSKIARGALLGARGNSGTILSMLFAGFSQAVEGVDQLDANGFAKAVQHAVEHTYREVRKGMEPVEGTILTVARESAEAIQERALYETDLKVLLSDMIAAARRSLENTPNLLPKLKEAGVVDSGGMGLVYILEGMQRLLNGQPVSYDDHSNGGVAVAENHSWEDALVPDDEEGYGYDVQFLMIGKEMDVDQVRADITAMGWSPLVHGDDQLIKVHIHVHNPGDPLTYAINQGVELDDIVVENMQAQYLQYTDKRRERETASVSDVEGVAIITVARGEGLNDVFRQYGASYVIEGGQTMNPSTEDFIRAIEAVNADDVIILPNNGNVIMAARQAAEISHSKEVRVVPSKTIQQGIAALFGYMDMVDAEFNEIHEAMCDHITHIVSGEITTATRNATINDVQVSDGQFIALVDGKLIAAGNDETAIMLELLSRAHAEDYELLTLYYGDNKSENDAVALTEIIEESYGDLEIEVVHGGQPLYPYLISLE